MWLKRKKKANLKIPSLKDEYARLLQDTLTDMRPLQDVAQAKPLRASSSGVVVQAHWCAHRKAIIPFTKPNATRRIAGPATQFRRRPVDISAGNAARRS